MAESERAGDPSREWFRDWFGEEYLELYPHRDAAEAARAVRLFLDLSPHGRGTVLDLACGAGRHLRELSAAGVDAVGLDLSGTLLREARLSDPDARLVRADMRDLPFADGAFGGVTSFFTSFGYFATREEDRRVASELRRVLVAGGPFLLDFFNAGRVRRRLVPRDERKIGERVVTQTREIRDDVVEKHIRIETANQSAPDRTFIERVRLYSPDELAELLDEAGLRPDRRFGSYEGDPFTDDAERLILFGHAR